MELSVELCQEKNIARKSFNSEDLLFNKDFFDKTAQKWEKLHQITRAHYFSCDNFPELEGKYTEV